MLLRTPALVTLLLLLSAPVPASDDAPQITIRKLPVNVESLPLSSGTGAGDVNGDGLGDIILANSNAGAKVAAVFFGGSLDAGPGIVITGMGSLFAEGVGGGGDLNGDGFDDFLVSSVTNIGQPTYVFFGAPSFPDSMTSDDADLALWYGVYSIFVGDVNGDGYDDILTGAAKGDRAMIYLGGADPDDVPDVEMYGAPESSFGTPIAAAGDVNGDGFDDWMVGGPAWRDGGPPVGRAHLYLGGLVPDNVPDRVFRGRDWGDGLGSSLSGGDLDGDGLSDLAVGSSPLWGPTPKLRILLSDTTSNTPTELVLEGRGGIYPDLNGDGFADLLHDGKVYWGGAPFDTIPDGSMPRGAVAGDVTGDGFIDLMSRRAVHNLSRYFVDQPIADQIWRGGSQEIVRWAGSVHADVQLSVDGGTSFMTLAQNVGGAESNGIGVIVPNVTTKSARVRIIPSDGAISGSAISPLFSIEGPPGRTPDKGANTAVPALSASPLPYRGGTLHVSFAPSRDLEVGTPVNVSIFDVAGRRIRQLTPGSPGTGRFAWDGRTAAGRDVPSGVYFLRLETSERLETVKLIVAR